MVLQETLENPRTSPILKELMKTVGNRYILLNAIDLSNDNYQVKMNQITKLVEGIQEACRHQPYTSEVFTKAAKEIKQELLDAKEEELVHRQEDIQQLRTSVQNLNASLQQALSKPQVVKEVHYIQEESEGCCTLQNFYYYYYNAALVLYHSYWNNYK